MEASTLNSMLKLPDYTGSSPVLEFAFCVHLYLQLYYKYSWLVYTRAIDTDYYFQVLLNDGRR